MAIPVRRGGRVIAVLARESPRSIRRIPGELEQTYRNVFDRFAAMIADGVFPFPPDPTRCSPTNPGSATAWWWSRPTAPSRYSSPNATSALIAVGVGGHVAGPRRDRDRARRGRRRRSPPADRSPRSSSTRTTPSWPAGHPDACRRSDDRRGRPAPRRVRPASSGPACWCRRTPRSARSTTG